ncbi:MAG: MptD family putative ECF transporter S component [Tissierellia bacterium]|nr:MptD family putative ECF transporter S component [Tissierellia bacterium]
MKLKDFIKIILFGVLGFILLTGGSYIPAIFGVYAVYFGHVFGSILVGLIFYVMCHKIHKKYTIFIFYTLSGIIYTIMGFWPMLPIMVIVGAVGEGIIGKEENYHNDKKITIAFIVSQFLFSLHGLVFILILKPEGLVKQFPDMFDAAMAKEMSDFLLNGKNLLILILIQLILSYVGARLGLYIYKKFFAKTSSEDSLLKE